MGAFRVWKSGSHNFPTALRLGPVTGHVLGASLTAVNRDRPSRELTFRSKVQGGEGLCTKEQ